MLAFCIISYKFVHEIPWRANAESWSQLAHYCQTRRTCCLNVDIRDLSPQSLADKLWYLPLWRSLVTCVVHIITSKKPIWWWHQSCTFCTLCHNLPIPEQPVVEKRWRSSVSKDSPSALDTLQMAQKIKFVPSTQAYLLFVLTMKIQNAQHCRTLKNTCKMAFP